MSFHNSTGSRPSNLPVQESGGEKKIHLISKDGRSLGIVSLKFAQQQAENDNVHLYLLKPSTHTSPHAVYKLIDKKTMYELEKKKKNNKPIKNVPKTKELSFSTDIAGQDFKWKLQKLQNLLLDQYKVNVIINHRRTSKCNKKEFFSNIVELMKDFGRIDGNIAETEQRIKCTLAPSQLTKDNQHNRKCDKPSKV